MRFFKLSIRVSFILICALIFAICANAQFKASIQGTVTDPQGSAVSGAKITLANQETGVGRDTVASDQGFYRINELPPGLYSVTVSVNGFKQFVAKDVAIEAEQPRGFDVVLTVGNVAESVTVTATAGGLQTENASINATIGSQEVLTLPQFGRDPYELIHMA